MQRFASALTVCQAFFPKVGTLLEFSGKNSQGYALYPNKEMNSPPFWYYLLYKWTRPTVSSTGGFHFPLAFSQRLPGLESGPSTRTDSVWGRTRLVVTNTEISRTSEAWSWRDLDSSGTMLGDWAQCPGCFSFRRGQFQGSNSWLPPQRNEPNDHGLKVLYFSILFS